MIRESIQIDAVNGGIMADGELRVSGKVFAAGDACSYYDESLGEYPPPPPPSLYSSSLYRKTKEWTLGECSDLRKTRWRKYDWRKDFFLVRE